MGVRFVVAVLVMAGCLLATAVPALAEVGRAPALPTGTDCLRPPTPASPSSGLAAWVDPGPAAPAVGDPFDANSGASLYDVYGYAGFDAIIFDPGCLDSSRIWDGPNEFTNAAMSLGAVATATSVRLTRLVMDGTFGSIWAPLQEHAQKVLGGGVFLPLLGVAITLTGLYILSRSRRGDLAGETRASTYSAIIILAGACAAGYALSVGAAVDSGITGAFSAANSLMSTSATAGAGAGTAGPVVRSPGDGVAINLIDQVMYRTWANETFGGNAAVAAEYGPRLFKAGALTRTEQAAIDADPAKAGPLIDSKKSEYKAIAKEIEDKYPQAYQHLAGNDTRGRAGYAIAGLLGVLSAVAYLLFCLIKTTWAMVVVRVGIGATPLVALVAQLPRWHDLAMELLTWVVEAVVKAAVFSFLFVVFLAGGIGGIMNPATTWHPLIKAAALVMASIAMHALLVRLGLAGKRHWRAPRIAYYRRDTRRPEPADREQQEETSAEPTTTREVFPTTIPARTAPPAEATQRTRRAIASGADAMATRVISKTVATKAAAAVAPHAAPAVIALGALQSARSSSSGGGGTKTSGAALGAVRTAKALSGTASGPLASRTAGRPPGASGGPTPVLARATVLPAASGGGTTRTVVPGTVVTRRLYKPSALPAGTRTGARAGTAVATYRPAGGTT